MSRLPDFNSPLERSIWVQGQLKLSGRSLASLSRQHGWHRGALYSALFQPSDPQEKALADALECTQQQLFPERYTPDGERRHYVRKDRQPAAAGNVKNEQAA